MVRPEISLRSSDDPQRFALLVELGFDAGEVPLRARLDFGGRVGVEALDRSQFGQVDEGDFVDRAEAFRCKKLGDRLVDVKGVHEILRPLGEFLLPALGLLGFRQDVDVPARELRGEAHVLPAAADRQRQLIVGNDNLDAS